MTDSDDQAQQLDEAVASLRMANAIVAAGIDRAAAIDPRFGRIADDFRAGWDTVLTAMGEANVLAKSLRRSGDVRRDCMALMAKIDGYSARITAAADYLNGAANSADEYGAPSVATAIRVGYEPLRELVAEMSANVTELAGNLAELRQADDEKNT